MSKRYATTSGAGCWRRPNAPASEATAAQSAGFTLDQISELIALDSTDDRARARELAMERITALDAKIAELKAARDALSRLARECGAGSAGPCPIITAFEPS